MAVQVRYLRDAEDDAEGNLGPASPMPVEVVEDVEHLAPPAYTTLPALLSRLVSEADTSSSFFTVSRHDLEVLALTKAEKDKPETDVLDTLRSTGKLSKSQLLHAVEQAEGDRSAALLGLARQRRVSESDIADCLPNKDARTAYAFLVEDIYGEHINNLMVRHQRNFKIFIAACTVGVLGSLWFADQLPPGSGLWATAGFATIYHQLQRRYYDLQAFYRHIRESTKTSIKNAKSTSLMRKAVELMKSSYAERRFLEASDLSVLHASGFVNGTKKQKKGHDSIANGSELERAFALDRNRNLCVWLLFALTVLCLAIKARCDDDAIAASSIVPSLAIPDQKNCLNWFSVESKARQ